MTQRTGKSTVFLSHSSRDKAFVEKLANDLNNAGIGVWFDKWEIKVGDSIVDKINQGIGEGDYLAVVLSTNSVVSPWVNRELNAGLMKELERRSVFILPILLEPCSIPLLISDKKYADFTVDYHRGMDDLLAVFQMSFPDAKLTYEELEFKDLSHADAKRYSANILVSPDAPRPLVREIVYRATQAFRTRNYYSNAIRRQHFGTRPADVVWLYVYQRLEDTQLSNWVCRSSWISPNYVDAPATLHVNPFEEYRGVRIQFRSEPFDWRRANKEDFLPFTQHVVEETERLMEGVRPVIRDLSVETAQDSHVIQRMGNVGDKVREIYFAWGRRPVPPIELNQLASAVSGLMAFADNVFLPFSENGLSTWKPENRTWLTKDAYRHYEEELTTVRVLLKLVH